VARLGRVDKAAALTCSPIKAAGLTGGAASPRADRWGTSPGVDIVLGMGIAIDRLAAREARWAESPPVLWEGLRFSGRGGLTWRPPGNFSEESAGLYRFRPESQVWVAMPPRTYLGLVRQVWAGQGAQFDDVAWEEQIRGRLVRGRQREELLERLRLGIPLDAVFADVDLVEGVALSQEGSHRAALAVEAGFERIPVILYSRRRHVGYRCVTPAFLRYARGLGTVTPSLAEHRAERGFGIR
jgi:hypothetical protein